MTRERLEQIVRGWQERLNIPHWRIKIDWDNPSDSENAAQIGREGELYEGAKLQFDADFEKWTEQYANEIVAHELMHAVMFDLQAASESAEEVMTGAAFKLFDRRIRHELEGVVDRIALLFVKFAGTIPAREETRVHAD